MAAAIAAAMPAAQQAPAPAQPTHEAIIPQSMSEIIDVEAEIPIRTVQLDALVCPAYHRVFSHSQLYAGRLENNQTQCRGTGLARARIATWHRPQWHPRNLQLVCAPAYKRGRGENK